MTKKTKKTKKIWIVMAVDYSDSSDGKAHIIATYFDYDMAKAYVKKDMDSYAEDCEDYPDFRIDYEKFSAWKDDTNGCEWSIESIGEK